MMGQESTDTQKRVTFVDRHSGKYKKLCSLYQIYRYLYSSDRGILLYMIMSVIATTPIRIGAAIFGDVRVDKAVETIRRLLDAKKLMSSKDTAEKQFWNAISTTCVTNQM